ncbi:sensor histidine kinase [Gracilimonas mengyeensis]|uniref:Histidine kinase n=1 Tax=Gracilimonas mengyeensis TaxID=1302730 RepID=A0A521BWP7_9BACT|nr:histidine kinase [Gracilimonas mengyeensis]SMO51021.1 Histidine kinase [Gracilimonas mengyeensis]
MSKENQFIEKIKIHKTQWIVAGIHVFGWLLLFSLPTYLQLNHPFGFELPWEVQVKNYLFIFLLLVLFYLNYFLLIPKMLFQRKFLGYAVSVVAIVLLTMMTNNLMHDVLNVNEAFREARRNDPNRPVSFIPPFQGIGDTVNPVIGVGMDVDSLLISPMPPPEDRGPERRGAFDFLALLSSMFIVLLGTGIQFGQQWYRNEQEKEEIGREKLQTELSFLKNQVNPHFFFNMLNNIYSLIQSKPDRAQKAVHKLSKLMRYMLYESSREKVTLGMEVNFMENYIELVKVRLSQAISVDFIKEVEDDELTIPPLLFIPFLENVFKHGVRQNDPAIVTIYIRQTKDFIEFLTQNNVYKPVNNTDQKGIGLKNAKRRLDLLYKDNYSLKVRDKGERFIVYLKIPV